MKKFVIVDIETTGNSPKNGDRIIQFAAVVVENNSIIDIYTTYVNPGIPIPLFITELTGISNEDVQHAPMFPEVADKILSLFQDGCFVAHNVHFDLNFLQEEFVRAGKPILTCPFLDTVELSRIFMPTLESYKLSDIASFAGFEHDRPHQADSDAIVTAEWFLSLIDKALELPSVTLLQLRDLSRSIKNNLYDLLDTLCREKEGKAETLPNSLEIYRGIALRKVSVSSLKESIHQEEILEIFPSERGVDFLYEGNPNQKDLAHTVYRALVEGDIALIETEPGFGKRENYLVPAAIFSQASGKPVVIAAHTVQRQTEMLERDIPRVERYIHRPISAVVVKGRNHYLNLWNFERLLALDSDNYDETIAKMQILVWLTETETGDVDELNLSTGGLLFWHRLVAERPFLEEKEPWEGWDFYKRLAKRAEKANLIITNHHFLTSDLTGKGSLLPNFDHLIIDEAHLFEKNVAKYFGKKISYRKIKYLLNQIGTTEKGKHLGNLFSLLKDKGADLPDPGELEQMIHRFSEESGDFFQVVLQQFHRIGKNQVGKNAIPVSLHNGDMLQYAWERFYSCYKDYYDRINDLLVQSFALWENMNEKEKIYVEILSYSLHELEEIEHLHQVSLLQSDNMILWAEGDDRHSMTSLSLYSQPLNIGKELADFLYTKKKGIIFLSNAMTVNHSFQFIKKQLGLLQYPVIERYFPTPLPEQKRPVLYILEDLPDISDTREEEFAEFVASSIVPLAEMIKGRILILFTSHEMLKNTYYLIKESGALEDYLLLAQGISSGSPHRLSRQFNQFSKVLLFGSYTFWEGGEIDRELISALMIVRLPFTSPNDPVHEGKNRMIQDSGGNSFYDLSLPEAVLRFKQGISQLFYSKKQGWIVVFDRRLDTRKYGKVFLKSIPDLSVEHTNLEELCDKMIKKRDET